MLHPDEIQKGTIEFCVKPSPSGIGYEVVITKGRRSQYLSCYRRTLNQVLGLIRHHTLEFYNEELDALERRIDGDPDVAGACCPACEDIRAR